MSGLLVGAAVASRLDGEMKGFRRALIRGVLLGPFDGDTTEVVRRRAQSLERSVLLRCQALRWLKKLRWHHRFRFGFCFAFTFGGHACSRGRRCDTPPIIAIAVNFVHRRGASNAVRDMRPQSRKLQ